MPRCSIPAHARCLLPTCMYHAIAPRTQHTASIPSALCRLADVAAQQQNPQTWAEPQNVRSAVNPQVHYFKVTHAFDTLSCYIILQPHSNLCYSPVVCENTRNNIFERIRLSPHTASPRVCFIHTPTYGDATLC